MRKILSFVQQIPAERVIIVVVAITVLLIISSFDFWVNWVRVGTPMPDGYHITLFVQSIRSEVFGSFIPILAAVLTSANYVEIIKNKVTAFILIRSDYYSFLFSILGLCFLTGGGVLLGGAIISYSGVALLLSPAEVIEKTQVVPYMNLWQTLWLLFLNGGFWASVGISISAFIESKYVAYLAPFVSYYILVILCERYLPDVFLLNPRNWLSPDVWPYGILGGTAFLLELTVLCGAAFVIRAERRLHKL